MTIRQRRHAGQLEPLAKLDRSGTVLVVDRQTGNTESVRSVDVLDLAYRRVLRSETTADGLRVWLAVMPALAATSDLVVKLSLADLTAGAGIGGRNEDARRRRTAAALRALATAGVIEYIPGRGRGHLSTIRVPKRKGL